MTILSHLFPRASSWRERYRTERTIAEAAKAQLALVEALAERRAAEAAKKDKYVKYLEDTLRAAYSLIADQRREIDEARNQLAPFIEARKHRDPKTKKFVKAGQ